jgi:predicted DNA-binding transcriptional regulator AlpA
MDTRTYSATQSDKLIPLGRARSQVGISRSKLYELLSRRAFPQPVKIGRVNYFSEREVQAWISARLAARRGSL